MKRFFSISQITEKAKISVKRFPISILLILSFTAMLLAKFEASGYKQEYYFLSVGIVISMVAILWLEDFVDYITQHLITTGIILLWAAYCFFLMPNDFSFYSKIIELPVIAMVAFLALFFISFLKKDKDNAFWNFTIKISNELCLAVFFSWILNGGLSIAILAITELFNLKTKIDYYYYLSVICFAIFAPLYFLANIPDKIAKYCEEVNLTKGLKIFALYILMPIAAVYAVILYVYLFKIIFAWELPRGSVSYLVSALACTGFVIITLLYPARFKFLRYFGLIMLPLLTLMTIGIIRRLSDYGISISRCYVLLLNIWLYGVFIYIFITKAERIKLIPVSFALIVLLSSVGPWSIANVTKHVLLAEIQQLTDAEKINDKVRYLRNTYGYDTVAGLDVPKSIDSASEVERGEYIYKAKVWDNEIKHINGFNAFVVLEYDYYSPDKEESTKDLDYSFEKNLLTIKIPQHGKTFSASLPELKDKMLIQGNGYMILGETFRGKHYKKEDSISMSSFRGYLFYNR